MDAKGDFGATHPLRVPCAVARACGARTQRLACVIRRRQPRAAPGGCKQVVFQVRRALRVVRKLTSARRCPSPDANRVGLSQATVKRQLDFQPRPSPLGSSTVYPAFFQSSHSLCDDMDVLSTGLIMRPARAPRTCLPVKIFSSGGQSGLSFSSLHNVASATRRSFAKETHVMVSRRRCSCVAAPSFSEFFTSSIVAQLSATTTPSTSSAPPLPSGMKSVLQSRFASGYPFSRIYLSRHSDASCSKPVARFAL